MKILRRDEKYFEETFQKIVLRGKIIDENVWTTVRHIVEDVARRKDAALFEYTKKYDGYIIDENTVQVTEKEIKRAMERVRKEDLALLRLVAKRIEKFHRSQILQDWFSLEEDGVELGLKVLPLERVGIYAPGGRATYPSTVLMAAIPARIAGVRDIILVTPCAKGKLNPHIAAAAHLGGITRIFKIGGAQAIAALAYGTESIPRVDKIVGPGNAYVTAAKKIVYGQVAIDMIAGPSEVVIIADGSAEPSYIASDLIAQAEHDECASALLITTNERLSYMVAEEVKSQLKTLKRRSIAKQSLEDFGAIVLVETMDEAVALANLFAPEHLELMVESPKEILSKVTHAGAVFLGKNTPEVLGDYCAGPNHILPTSGTARFSSPLGVYDFVKRSSVLSFSSKALRKFGKYAAQFAKLEGLEGHANAIAVRLSRKKS